jgi:hypothetical protein
MRVGVKVVHVTITATVIRKDGTRQEITLVEKRLGGDSNQ